MTNKYHNMSGAKLFLSAASDLNDNTTDRMGILRAAARGYKFEHDAIVKANGGSVPKGKALNKALRDRLTNNEEPAQVAKLNTLCYVGCDVLASGMLGTRTRDGLLWIADHDDQFVAMCGRDSNAKLEPLPLHAAWKRKVTADIKAAIKDGEKPSNVKGHLLTDAEVDTEWNKQVDAQAKREEKAKDQPAPKLEHQAAQLISIINDSDLDELQALRAMIDKRIAAKGGDAPTAVGEYTNLDQSLIRDGWMDGTPMYVGTTTPEVKLIEHTDGTILAIDLKTGKEETTPVKRGDMSATQLLAAARKVSKLPAKVPRVNWWT